MEDNHSKTDARRGLVRSVSEKLSSIGVAESSHSEKVATAPHRAVERPNPPLRAGQKSAHDIISARELQNESLYRQLKQYQMELAYARSVEEKNHVRMQELERRLEESVSTLFRLRPQRLQCTETEVKDEYHSLTRSIKTWVETNCEDFLDDEDLGFEFLQQDRLNGSSSSQAFDTLLDTVSQQPRRWNKFKDSILVALIMRCLLDHVLRSQFPVWLQGEHREFLRELEDGMKTLEPERDLYTQRSWKSDTILSILSLPSSAEHRSKYEQDLAAYLFRLIRKALPDHQNDDYATSVKNSILVNLAKPSMALAQKIQSATSVWEFRHSSYERYSPGQRARDLRDFLQTIDQFHCVNLAAHGKVLKPATDLTTRHEMDRLVYLLDVFPGLYCQRVDSENSSTVYTIAQPVVLVTFLSSDPPATTNSSEFGGNASLGTEQQSLARNSSYLKGHDGSRLQKDHSSNSKARDPVNTAANTTPAALWYGVKDYLVNLGGTGHKADSREV